MAAFHFEFLFASCQHLGIKIISNDAMNAPIHVICVNKRNLVMSCRKPYRLGGIPAFSREIRLIDSGVEEY
jgi:hypothetical protein